MINARTIFDGRGQREAAAAVDEARTRKKRKRRSNGAVVDGCVELFDFIFRSLLLEAAAARDGDIVTERSGKGSLSLVHARSLRENAQASSRATLQR